MTDRHRTHLRCIMTAAWGRYRADANRGFAFHLRGAWAFSKRMAKACAKLMKQADAQGGKLQFNDLTRSPIRRSLTGQRRAKQADFRAAYTTAVFGG